MSVEDEHRMGHALLLKFDTDCPDFARGFEMGRLWQRLQEDRDEVDEVVHSDMAEMVLRTSEALARPLTAEQLDDRWMRVVFAASARE